MPYKHGLVSHPSESDNMLQVSQLYLPHEMNTTGELYVVRTEGCMNTPDLQNVFKVASSVNSVEEFHSYPKGSMILAVFPVSRMAESMSEFLKISQAKGILPRRDVGSNHFEGQLTDILQVLRTINQMFPCVERARTDPESFGISKRTVFLWHSRGGLRIITKKQGNYSAFMKECDQPRPDTYIIENPAVWHAQQLSAQLKLDQQRWKVYDLYVSLKQASVDDVASMARLYNLPTETITNLELDETLLNYATASCADSIYAQQAVQKEQLHKAQRIERKLYEEQMSRSKLHQEQLTWFCIEGPYHIGLTKYFRAPGDDCKRARN